MLSSDRHPKVWVFAFMFYGTLLSGMSLCKSLGVYEPELKDLARLMGGDKWMHFFFSAGLSVLTLKASHSCFVNCNEVLRISVIVVLLLVILSVEEFLQLFSDNRAVDIRDVFYGMSGVLSGTGLYTLTNIGNIRVRFLSGTDFD